MVWMYTLQMAMEKYDDDAKSFFAASDLNQNHTVI